MIQVTLPFLPPQKEYTKYIEDIWTRNWLTNDGPLVKELEKKLKEYLNLTNLLFVSNGTIALQLAIKALEIKGEIITTPFSYVATTSSIVWEGCKPVFVDIDEETFNIDPRKIENAITEHTRAILATHVFGNPCQIDEISKIAQKHNLKVIYDAAHSFGTLYKDRTVFGFGDISTTSFHATKLFHTIEGGSIFTKDSDLITKISYLRNFGHDGPEKFASVGINAKNSEFHAAMGLCNFNYINDILATRKAQSLIYDQIVASLNVKKQLITKDTLYNYSYYPILFESEEILLKTMSFLQKNEIFTRRYFYPSLSSLTYVDKYETPISDNISKRVLCLPIYHSLKRDEQEKIGQLLLKIQNR